MFSHYSKVICITSKNIYIRLVCDLWILKIYMLKILKPENRTQIKEIVRNFG